jgi:MFS family permease
MLAFTAVRGIANSFVNTSWNSWMRDIVPQNIMGAFFSRRMRNSTLVAAIIGLAAALYIDWWKGIVPEDQVVLGYSFAMLFGSLVLGWAAVLFMGRMPEPQMPAPQMPALQGLKVPMHKTLAAPFSDKNFRQLMIFFFLRNFTTQLAVPFFTVYMLVRLGMPLTLVVALGVLSQISHVLFLRVWGPMVDQFGSKVILSICTSLYSLVILGWAFTTMPERYFLTVPLLVVLHMLAGIANAGINISSMTLRMKMAPQVQATSYLTGASLAINLGAGISPLLGGFFADFFSERQLRLRAPNKTPYGGYSSRSWHSPN